MPSNDHTSLSTETLLALRASPELLRRVEVSDLDELALQRELRQQYPDDVVRLAVTLHHLRIRGAAKFDRAGEMWFDRVGLEQATTELVAQHKAKRFSGDVDDLCCGIGAGTCWCSHNPNFGRSRCSCGNSSNARCSRRRSSISAANRRRCCAAGAATWRGWA